MVLLFIDSHTSKAFADVKVALEFGDVLFNIVFNIMPCAGRHFFKIFKGGAGFIDPSINFGIDAVNPIVIALFFAFDPSLDLVLLFIDSHTGKAFAYIKVTLEFGRALFNIIYALLQTVFKFVTDAAVINATLGSKQSGFSRLDDIKFFTQLLTISARKAFEQVAERFELVFILRVELFNPLAYITDLAPDGAVKLLFVLSSEGFVFELGGQSRYV